MQALSAVLLLVAPHPVCASELHVDVAGKDLLVSVARPTTPWVLGETVDLQATLTNTGQTPFRVDTFGELQAVYQGKRKAITILSCWTLIWEPPVAFPGPHRGKTEPAKEHFVLLAPQERHTRSLSVPLSGIAPGRYQVKLAYAPRVATPSFSFPEHWLDQQKIAEPIWTGMIVSEAFEVVVQ